MQQATAVPMLQLLLLALATIPAAARVLQDAAVHVGGGGSAANSTTGQQPLTASPPPQPPMPPYFYVIRESFGRLASY